jgi:3-hydroxybutyryl-CoA dehydratase
MTVLVGAKLGPWTIENIDPEKMKAFAVLLADPNPIHLDPKAASAAGLGERVINQGPASFGYVLNMLREAVPEATISELNVRLTANVFAGDRVTAGGTVESVWDGDGVRQLNCRVWLDVESGRRALEGAAVLMLPTS